MASVKYTLHLLEGVILPWHHPKKRWQLTCYFVRIDCRINKNLSTKCPNQGLLIDGTVDITLSKFCQLGHIYSCSVFIVYDG